MSAFDEWFIYSDWPPIIVGLLVVAWVITGWMSHERRRWFDDGSLLVLVLRSVGAHL